MKAHSKILICLMAAAVYLLLGIGVFADRTDAIPDGTGTITIHMKDVESEKPVPGGALQYYQVAVPVRTDGNDSWVYTRDFAACDVPLTALDKADTAYGIDDYAAENKLSGTEVSVSADGTVQMTDLPAGVYLMVQTKPAEGYSAFQPFLVTLPQVVDGAYIYDVDATPKVELKKETTPPPSEWHGKRLPQTGQLWWPVFAMGAGGAVLLLAGIALRKRSAVR